MARTKILHLIDTTGPGGAEELFISLADKLRSQHIESLVVIRGEGYLAKRLRELNIDPIIIPAKGRFNVLLLWRLVSLVLRLRINLIQSHLLGSNVYAALVGLITRVPVVACYHGMVDVAPNERFRTLKRWVMRRGISRYIAVSQRLAEQIAKNKLLDPKRTRVIHNGINLSAYSSEQNNALRDSLQLPQDTLLLGALGNIRQPKRYDVLLEAMALCQQAGMPLALAVAGDTHSALLKQLQTQATNLGLRHIFFLGFVTDSGHFLAGLDGFILSSDSEGFSIATIEAMASALPLVLTRCGGPEEIIGEQAFAHFSKAGDSHALAKAMQAMIRRIKQGEPRQPAARQWVEKHYSIKAMLAGYLAVYQELVVTR